MFLTLIYRQKPQYGHTAPPLLELLLIPLGGVYSFLPTLTEVLGNLITSGLPAVQAPHADHMNGLAFLWNPVLLRR